MILDFNQAFTAKQLETYLGRDQGEPVKIDTIREGLAANAAHFVAYLYPSAIFSRTQARIGNTDGDPGGSLLIETSGSKAGIWKDFGDPSQKGGDLIALYQAQRRCSFHVALQECAEWLGQGTRPEVVYSRQQLLAKAKKFERDLGPQKGEWHYTDAEGSIIASVYRFEPDSGGKEYLPWDALKRRYGNPDVRPLYNIPGILQSDTVVFCEGEKAAKSLIDRGICATAVMGGSNSPLDKTDLSPLSRKDVLIWPDADEPGFHFAAELSTFLKDICSSISLVTLPEGLPQGWDAADATQEQLDVILARPSSAPPRVIAATPFTWRAESAIPPRKWLYGRHLLRKFLSVDIAAGGVGKSSLKIGEALALASGKDIYAQGLHEGRLCVWLYNLEDPTEETERRLHAAAKAFNITPDEVSGRLYVDSGRDQRCVIATETPNGVMIMRPVADAIIAEIQERGIDVLCIDPFVSSHAVSENDNMAIDVVAKEWARIADVCNCSINLVHHVRKQNGQEATADSARGASALIGAARSVMVYNRMSAEEAQKVGVAEEDARFFFRVDNDKANLAPPGKASWYRMNNIDLANGDAVGVACSWKAPDPFDGLSSTHLMRVQKEVGAGEWRENIQAQNWVGYAVAEALMLDGNHPNDRARIKILIREWLRSGVLEIVEQEDSKRMKRKFVIVGRWVTE